MTGEKEKWSFEKAHSILHMVSDIVLWGNSDNTSCQAPEVHTWYILVHTSTYLVHTQYILNSSDNEFCQHAHIENFKTVANLTNNKDVFMCILCFHALVGYLQTYENLLKEINEHPGSAPVSEDQFQVESVALVYSNFNIACETGILYPSLVAMLNRRSMLWRATVIFHVVHVYTSTY